MEMMILGAAGVLVVLAALAVMGGASFVLLFFQMVRDPDAADLRQLRSMLVWAAGLFAVAFASAWSVAAIARFA